ncbi:hypothetical protein HMN09_01211000 [Mycena chlorophos]|uniref:BTB domain-containing protein n=1 Tax=Mycena chlorophos TaxID=658473 RepID=A0A8H6S5P4_MYCCL|nr:hypothetical protein HMN09_01211000 [Mycena chlorophos]
MAATHSLSASLIPKPPRNPAHSTALVRRTSSYVPIFGKPSSLFLAKSDLPAGVLNEGLIPTDPIIIPREITKDMFEAYLIYLLLGPPDHPLSNTFLINLLHICDMFGPPDGLEYVRQKFADRNLVAHDPAFVFYLAHRYHMADWIGPAFEMLLKREPADLSARDSEYIGESVSEFSTRPTGKLRSFERGSLIPRRRTGPIWRARRERCHDAWDSFWGKIILPYIHHPDYPIALADIHSFLAPLNTVPNMCIFCKRRTLLSAADDLAQEEQLIFGALNEVAGI